MPGISTFSVKGLDFFFESARAKVDGKPVFQRVRFIQARQLVATLGLLFCALPVRAQADRAHELASQASGQVTSDCQNVTTLADCHPGKPTGCSNAASPRYDAYLNFLKNQEPARDIAPSRVLGVNDLISLEDQIPAGIGRSNHAQFADQLADRGNGVGEGNIYAVVGYLYFVENTAITSHHRGETCNCQLRGNSTFDYHLGIGFDATLAQEIRTAPPVHDPRNPVLPEQSSVVAEMTPHTRAVKWTVARLNGQLGKQVKVIGQLTLDNVHVNSNDDCAFLDEPGGSCWRASAWEIHPVTQFFVCKAGKTCSATSPDSDWVRLEDLP